MRLSRGNRSRSAVLRAPFRAGHYRAAAGMVRAYPREDLRENLGRFLTGGGEYPYRIRVRTPLGIVTPTLWTSHDMSTVNEVFCRRDYRAGADLRVAVDIGSNIGISALYFLTRSPSARAYCFEPDPKNVARLRENLAPYAPRWELEEAAVHTEAGEVEFGVEDTGRYGGIGVATGETIRVRAREINDVLGAVLERERTIDVLKIDTEDTEVELVSSIRPRLLDRIRVILYETDGPTPLHPDRYGHRFSCQTNRLVRRAA